MYLCLHREDPTLIIQWHQTHCGAKLKFTNGAAVAAAAKLIVSKDGWTRVDMATGHSLHAEDQTLPLYFDDGVRMLLRQYAALWTADDAFQDVAEACYGPSTDADGHPVRQFSHPMSCDYCIRVQQAVRDNEVVRAHRSVQHCNCRCNKLM